MTHFKTASLALAMLAFASGAALAQTNSTGSMSSTEGMSSSEGMSTGAMSTGAMSSSAMSKADMATLKHCQAMSHDAMMKNAKCMKMMKMHPDAMSNEPPMGH